jgi:hypothetical protein
MTNSVLMSYLEKELPAYERCKAKMKEENFHIPDFHEHYLLFKYNYTVSQLKEICKAYKIPRSGNKTTLMKYIYNYLYYSHHSVTLQKCARGYLQRKLNNLRGPAYLKRDRCVNDSDFFSLEPLAKISPIQFYSFEDADGFIYGFDIMSLWQLFKKSDVIENPYNRQSLPDQTLKTLKYLIKLNKKSNTKIVTEIEDNELNLEKQLELRILTLFQFINTLGHYTDHSWFLNLNERYLIRFYRELYDIWAHRAQISNETKRRIYPQGNPFRVNYNNLSHTNSLYELRKFCVQVCENLVFYGIGDDDKTLGAYYILTALTLQSHDAAVALPWLYQSVAQV